MNMNTYETMIEDLRELYDCAEIETDVAKVYEVGQHALGVFPRGGNAERRTTSFVLSENLVPKPDIQYLAWGIVDLDGRIVEVGRTDAQGTFQADLRPGKYHVRYVAEIEDQLDRAILKQLNDFEANSLLTADTPILVPIVTGWSFSMAMSASTDFDSEPVVLGHELPPGQHVGRSLDRKWFRIELPMKRSKEAGHRFEFGVAVVVMKFGHTVLRRLIPIVEDNRTGCFIGELELDPLTPSGMHLTEIAGFDIYVRDGVICVDSGKLEPEITKAEWAQLLAEPLVEHVPEISNKVKSLIPWLGFE